MKRSDDDYINRQLEEVVQAMHEAKARRQESFEQALDSKNLSWAIQLVAPEVSAEKRLKQVMIKFGDQANTWGWRASKANVETHSSDIKAAYSRMQAYAEAELACREALQQSETKSIRLKLVDLEVMLASYVDLQKLYEKWSDKAERAREAGDVDQEKFAFNCKSICQKALDAEKFDV